MKRIKRVIRVASLILFLLLAVGGIGISGIAPVLTKDRKLFVQTQAESENTEMENKDSSPNRQLSFQEIR